MYTYLKEERHETILSKQLLRSGTSIGANIREARCAQSEADFYAKLFISLKEANERAYWLELLYESDILIKGQFESIYDDCQELIKLLVAITHETVCKQKVLTTHNVQFVIHHS